MLFIASMNYPTKFKLPTTNGHFIRVYRKFALLSLSFILFIFVFFRKKKKGPARTLAMDFNDPGAGQNLYVMVEGQAVSETYSKSRFQYWFL